MKVCERKLWVAMIAALALGVPDLVSQEAVSGRYDPTYVPEYVDGGMLVGLPNGNLVVHNRRRLYELGPEGQVIAERNFTPSIQQPTSYNTWNAIADTEGRLVTVGYVAGNDTAANTRLRRFFPGGLQDDGSFVELGGFNGRVRDIAELPGRGYVVVGEFTKIGTLDVMKVALIDYNGSVVEGYGHTTNTNFFHVAVGADNGVYVAAETNVYRLDANGAIDGSYQLLHPPFQNLRYGDMELLHPLRDGRLFIVSERNRERILHIRNPDGSPAADFNNDLRVLDSTRMVGAPGLVRAVVEMDDARLILAGDFTHYGEIPVVDHFRIHPDGSFDDTYDSTEAFRLGSINSAVGVPGFVFLASSVGAKNNLNQTNAFQNNTDLGGGPVRVFTDAKPSLGNLMGQSARDLGNGFYETPGFGLLWEAPGGMAYSESLRSWLYFDLTGPALDDPEGLWFAMYIHNQLFWTFSQANILAHNDSRLIYIPTGLDGAPGWFRYDPATRQFTPI